MLLQIEGLQHSYAPHQLTFTDLSFSLEKGELFCLLGPSGCGKSTLLQCLAGFEKPQKGRVILKGSDITQLPPEKRGIGLVFQDYSLFPHLTIEQNITYGLRHFSKQQKRERCLELLELFNLTRHQKKFPHELSGGEQQRVAIARAMAPKPELILFDEAFSNLDPSLRKNLRQELKDLLHQTQTSAIFITHDQEEAFDMGERIGILYEGKLQQIGPAFELYHFPETEFMARFIGSNQFIDGKNLGDGQVETSLGKIKLSLPDELKDVLVYLPYSSFKLHAVGEGQFRGKIKRKSFQGESYRYDVSIPKLEKEFSQIQDIRDFKWGEEIELSIDTEKINRAFPRFI